MATIESNEIGLMDYRYAGDGGVKVVREEDTYTIEVTFYYTITEREHKIRLPENFAELWCKHHENSAKDIFLDLTEYSFDNPVEGSEKWVGPTTLQFKVLHQEKWNCGEDMTAESVKAWIEGDSLEDGVYEGDDAFWIIHDDEATEVVGKKVVFRKKKAKTA